MGDDTNEILRQVLTALAELREASTRMETALAEMNDVLGAVVDHLEEGYWEERGYDVDGWVGRSNGRDDRAT